LQIHGESMSPFPQRELLDMHYLSEMLAFMSHTDSKAIARLNHTIQLVEGEIERLEAVAPTLADSCRDNAVTLMGRLRSQAAALRGQV
jgi:hypothetical protein